MNERDVPLGISTAIGAVAVVICCGAPAALDAQGRDARFALLVLGVAVFAVAIGDLAAVVVTAGVAFLLFDGFVEGHQGDLVWTGRSDVVHVALLYGSGLLGLLLAAARRRRAAAGSASPPAAAPPVPPQRTSPERLLPEESHGCLTSCSCW